MATKRLIEVEVVYALPQEQVVVRLELEEGATVEAAICASGLLARYREIDLATQKVGIFGRVVGLEEVLRGRDRVEIYRPLIADPKEARKKRVQGRR